MAAAELKHDNVLQTENAKGNVSAVISHREIECYKFRSLDLIYYLTSVSFFFADIATDSIIFMEYLLQGQFAWGGFALSFTILPAAIVQLFSLRWYHSDGSLKSIHWPLHFMFLGVLHRYLILLYATIHSLRSKRFAKNKNWVYRQESDICMLHLFESFLGAAPQLILQLYVMAILRRTPIWTSISAVVSFCSLSWAIGTYMKAMHKMNPEHNETTWIALTLQGLWRAGMLISRIAVLVLTAICLKEWFLLFIACISLPNVAGLHWLFMTVWVILQNTDFCPTVWEERIYNCIIGLIYCFDFFNLRVGKSRYRVLIFYSIIMIQNLLFLVVYIFYFKDTIKSEEIAIVVSVIIGGTMIGLTSMLFYYGKFHPSKVGGIHDITDKRSETVIDKAATPRSFKQYYPNSFASLPRSGDASQVTVSEETTTDKQFLLTNIVQNSESTEDGIVNQACKIDNESKTAVCVVSECDSPQQSNFSTVENTLNQNSVNALSKATVSSVSEGGHDYFDIQNDCNDIAEKDIHRQKRRGICLPTAHSIDIDKDSNTCLPSQKRRGICSSAQLILEMENDIEENITVEGNNSSKTVAADTNREELDDKRGPLENVCEDLDNVEIRHRLKALMVFDDTCDKISVMEKLSKELQQRDETMSCVTSIHDYENVCPLGVARPPWCIRSWKGYTDIETYIHDDSVVRDRRRDTLTSTTTGTTYSSEFSDTTCASSILRGILKQDDYLDTLTYDLIDPRELRSAYNDNTSVKTSSNVDDQNAALYIAKPVVIDEKGGMFALDTILEEHDETPLDDNFVEYTRPGCDSVSTLVSTIDQIRRYTADNSPRHVYHTTGSQWEDLDPKTFIKRAQLTRALFKNDLKDPTASSRNYINSFDESESSIRGRCEIDTIRDLVKYCNTTIESIKKTPLIDAILSDSPILGNKAKLQKQLCATYRKTDESTNESDLYVEMNPLVPVENVNKLVNNNLSETVSSDPSKSDTGNVKSVSTSADIIAQTSNSSCRSEGVEKALSSCEKRKKTLNYPKRKFSLLKERFEPKSQLVYVVTPANAIKVGRSPLPVLDSDPLRKSDSVSSGKSPDLSARQDKENLAPIVVPKANPPKSFSTENSEINREKADKIYENDKTLCNADFNLKERRHIFLEQVLSPPKLLTWNKRKTLAPASKEL